MSLYGSEILFPFTPQSIRDSCFISLISSLASNNSLSLIGFYGLLCTWFLGKGLILNRILSYWKAYESSFSDTWIGAKQETIEPLDFRGLSESRNIYPWMPQTFYKPDAGCSRI